MAMSQDVVFVTSAERLPDDEQEAALHGGTVWLVTFDNADCAFIELAEWQADPVPGAAWTCYTVTDGDGAFCVYAPRKVVLH